MTDHQDEEASSSYVDYETFLAPDFDAAAFANGLVVSTNNPNDSPLDLSTPLSRVLFDAQEVDSRIDLLATRSAVPLLKYTQGQTGSSRRILAELDGQIASLNDSYRQLEREVIDKHAEADEVRQVALRLWETLRLARAVGRCLQLGRQLEAQYAELGRQGQGDHAAMVRCAHTVVALRDVLDQRAAAGDEAHGLARVDAVRSLQDTVVTPVERAVREAAERTVRDFSMPATATFAQGDEARARLVHAMIALYLLSPVAGTTADPEKWRPRLLLQALEAYMRSALQAGVAALSRSLGQLPTLEKSLADVSARCQSIVALEIVLDATKAPAHPSLPKPSSESKQTTTTSTTLLQTLLAHLETGSLPSYYWRTMAGSLSGRVQELMSRGGVVARTLKSNKVNVGEAIRQAVVRGCQAPPALAGVKDKDKDKAQVNTDREVAVMVASVVNSIGR